MGRMRASWAVMLTMSAPRALAKELSMPSPPSLISRVMTSGDAVVPVVASVVRASDGCHCRTASATVALTSLLVMQPLKESQAIIILFSGMACSLFLFKNIWKKRNCKCRN